MFDCCRESASTVRYNYNVLVVECLVRVAMKTENWKIGGMTDEVRTRPIRVASARGISDPHRDCYGR